MDSLRIVLLAILIREIMMKSNAGMVCCRPKYGPQKHSLSRLKLEYVGFFSTDIACVTSTIINLYYEYKESVSNINITPFHWVF